MDNNSKTDNNLNQQHIHDAIKNVVQQGENISDQVRDITLQALAAKHFDTNHIKSVITTVWDATKETVDHQSEQVKQTFGDVMTGLDEALEKYAHASKLAIEETAGKLQTFTKQDLKQTLDDLKGLETMFFDTMLEAAQNTKATFSEVLTDLMGHAKNSGTEVGRRALHEFDELSTKLGKTGKESISAASDVALSFSAEVANTASGFLAELAEKLRVDNSKK